MVITTGVFASSANETLTSAFGVVIGCTNVATVAPFTLTFN
jgi:hypothetical protein